jgi:phosphate transport system permease protein
MSLFRKLQNIVMLSAIWAVAFIAIIPLMLVFFYVLQKGMPAVDLNFFTQLPAPVGQPGGGMANALLGSVTMIFLASLLGVPMGILGGAYLSEFGVGKTASALRFAIDMLASVPSIIVGLFIYTIIVMPMKSFSAFAGAAALLVIMIPIIAKTTEEVLKLTPSHIREAGLALGIPRWNVILSIVIRGAKGPIATGVILAIARVAGETAPLLFTAFGSRFWLSSLNEPVSSLPVQIYQYAISPFEEWHRQAWAGALLLVFVVFFTNVGTRLLLRGNSGQASRR